MGRYFTRRGISPKPFTWSIFGFLNNLAWICKTSLPESSRSKDWNIERSFLPSKKSRLQSGIKVQWVDQSNVPVLEGSTLDAKDWFCHSEYSLNLLRKFTLKSISTKGTNRGARILKNVEKIDESALMRCGIDGYGDAAVGGSLVQVVQGLAASQEIRNIWKRKMSLLICLLDDYNYIVPSCPLFRITFHSSLNEMKHSKCARVNFDFGDRNIQLGPNFCCSCLILNFLKMTHCRVCVCCGEFEA